MSKELFPGSEVAFAHRAHYACGRRGLPVNRAGSQAGCFPDVVAAPDSIRDILHDVVPGRVAS
jgi:hypothetical protein